jgi:hypothetical protein
MHIRDNLTIVCPMESPVVRVDLEPRHEGVLLRLTLSRAAVAALTENGELYARMGEEGVCLMEDSPLELLHGDDAVELVRLEVRVTE